MRSRHRKRGGHKKAENACVVNRYSITHGDGTPSDPVRGQDRHIRLIDHRR